MFGTASPGRSGVTGASGLISAITGMSVAGTGGAAISGDVSPIFCRSLLYTRHHLVRPLPRHYRELPRHSDRARHRRTNGPIERHKDRETIDTYLGHIGNPIWSMVWWKEGTRQMTSPVATRLPTPHLQSVTSKSLGRTVRCM